MFDREEINAMIKAAHPQVAAMIYLGINCGFGNTDCGTLTFDKLDLNNGWHNYWRLKTHVPRRCPLWPETVKAIRKAQEKRPKRISKDCENLVFVTRVGGCWCKHETGDNAISAEIREMLKDLGIYRKNVTTSIHFGERSRRLGPHRANKWPLTISWDTPQQPTIWRPSIDKRRLTGRCGK